MQPIIVENLNKSYSGIDAVKDVSFRVEEGEIFGLIGPDGAGKTTILRTVVSLLVPDSGRVLFQGREVASNQKFVRKRVGYMPQRFSLYQDLTVEQNLRFFGDLFMMSLEEQKRKIDELYGFSKLGPFKNRRAGNLSGGMKQKLALSCMLIHEPDVMVLDEPTFGVDPVSRSEFWDILHTLAGRGIALLVTTAYMDEASQCDRIGLMLNGEILALDIPQNLVKNFEIPVYQIVSEDPHRIFSALQKAGYEGDVQLFGSGVHFLDRSGKGLNQLKRRLDEMNLDYDQVGPIEPDLENVFLNLMIHREHS